MLTTLYNGAHLSDVDTLCWYPSHSGAPKHRSHVEYLDRVSRLFRDAHVPDLLVRHVPAQKLATARHAGALTWFSWQVNSVHLNPARRKNVEGKHVLVLDDFCTEGHSFEWARNLLYAAGARLVTCVACGRYHDEYNIYSPKKGVDFDPWAPVELGKKDGDFTREIVRGVIDASAMEEHQRLLRLVPAGTTATKGSGKK